MKRKQKITLVIVGLVAAAILACGFIGLKDAQALDTNATFLTNFVDNLKSDAGILACASVVGVAALSIFVPRITK